MPLKRMDYQRLLLLRTALRRFLRKSEQLAQSVGLTPAQHQLLLAIYGHDAVGDPTISEVSEYLLLRHHSVVQLVDRASVAGLVVRLPDDRDARRVRLRLTEKGRQALESLSQLHLDELRRLGDAFQPLWDGLEEL